jgi:hypothetical protein
MFDSVTPPFYANFLVELYQQTGSADLVGAAAQVLFKDCSPLHIKNVRQFLPLELVRLLPNPPHIH